MPRNFDDAYSTRTKSIADNLGKELKRIAMSASWREAEKFVDLLGVAQAVYAIEDVAPTETKEAQMLRAAAVRFERLLCRGRDLMNPLILSATQFCRGAWRHGLLTDRFRGWREHAGDDTAA